MSFVLELKKKMANKKLCSVLNSVCRNHNPVIYSFITFQRICEKSNTMGATCGARSAHPSGAPEFTPGF